MSQLCQCKVRPFLLSQLGHQASVCTNGTINWKQIYGDDAFRLKQPIYESDYQKLREAKKVRHACQRVPHSPSCLGNPDATVAEDDGQQINTPHPLTGHCLFLAGRCRGVGEAREAVCQGALRTHSQCCANATKQVQALITRFCTTMHDRCVSATANPLVTILHPLKLSSFCLLPKYRCVQHRWVSTTRR